MYFVPVKLFILEIKEKKTYIWRKIVWPLNAASAQPGIEFGLFGGVNQFFVSACFMFSFISSLKIA